MRMTYRASTAGFDYGMGHLHHFLLQNSANISFRTSDKLLVGHTEARWWPEGLNEVNHALEDSGSSVNLGDDQTYQS